MLHGGTWLGPLECLFLVMVTFALLAVVVVFAVIVARAGAARAGETPRESALEILRRRLAAGEITPEQFDEARRRLEA